MTKLFDTLVVYPKEFFEDVDFEKNDVGQKHTQKNMENNYQACKELGYQPGSPVTRLIFTSIIHLA